MHPEETRYYARNFVDVLEELRSGTCEQELTEKLNLVTEAAFKTGKTGELTLKLKITPKGTQAIVKDEIKHKAPEHDIQPTIMFRDGDNNLTRHNATQMSLGDVVTVDQGKEPVNVDPDTGEVVKVEKDTVQ